MLGLGDKFRYVHQLEDADDRVAILEFATAVEGKQVEGIDKLTFDENGKITELKVMIRPASALQLVDAKMAEEFHKVGCAFQAERPYASRLGRGIGTAASWLSASAGAAQRPRSSQASLAATCTGPGSPYADATTPAILAD